MSKARPVLDLLNLPNDVDYHTFGELDSAADIIAQALSDADLLAQITLRSLRDPVGKIESDKFVSVVNLQIAVDRAAKNIPEAICNIRARLKPLCNHPKFSLLLQESSEILRILEHDFEEVAHLVNKRHWHEYPTGVQVDKEILDGELKILQELVEEFLKSLYV